MKTFEYSDGQETFVGYLSLPAHINDKRPCVLVAHAWDGANDYFNSLADDMAAKGYVAFALDVYGKGKRGQIDGDNSYLMDPLMNDRSLLRQRLMAAFAVMKSHHAVDPTKIAILGYCFGGLCALDLARANPPGLCGAISVHGQLLAPPQAKVREIGASILVLHGWEDPIVKPEAIDVFAEEMTEAKADWQVHCYGHAKHAFTFVGADIPELGIKYNAEAHQRSLKSTDEFLKEVFKP